MQTLLYPSDEITVWDSWVIWWSLIWRTLLLYVAYCGVTFLSILSVYFVSGYFFTPHDLSEMPSDTTHSIAPYFYEALTYTIAHIQRPGLIETVVSLVMSLVIYTGCVRSLFTMQWSRFHMKIRLLFPQSPQPAYMYDQDIFSDKLTVMQSIQISWAFLWRAKILAALCMMTLIGVNSVIFYALFAHDMWQPLYFNYFIAIVYVEYLYSLYRWVFPIVLRQVLALKWDEFKVVLIRRDSNDYFRKLTSF